MLTQLYNLFWRWYNGNDFDMYSEEEINKMKGNVEKIIDIAKEFLQWLIKNGYIKEIESEKKSGPDINDYIKYIAGTEDPVDTLINMLKTEEKK